MIFYILMGTIVVGTAVVIYGASMLFSNDEKLVNSRLEALTSNRGRGASKPETSPNESVLKSPLKCFTKPA